MCVHVCVYMCMCMCMFMYICVSVYMYAYTCICTRGWVYIRSRGGAFCLFVLSNSLLHACVSQVFFQHLGIIVSCVCQDYSGSFLAAIFPEPGPGFE